MKLLPKDPRQHLFDNIEVNAITGCWNWTGNLFQGGYGVYKCKALTGRKQINASRASWMIHNGPIEAKQFVCHSCDNRRCCNPDHLFLGDAKKNMEDCVAKDRMNKGEDRPMSKLTEEKVIELRALFSKGALTYRAAAKKYGVATSCIVSAVKRKTWKHVK